MPRHSRQDRRKTYKTKKHNVVMSELLSEAIEYLENMSDKELFQLELFIGAELTKRHEEKKMLQNLKYWD